MNEVITTTGRPCLFFIPFFLDLIGNFNILFAFLRKVGSAYGTQTSLLQPTIVLWEISCSKASFIWAAAAATRRTVRRQGEKLSQHEMESSLSEREKTNVCSRHCCTAQKPPKTVKKVIALPSSP